MNQKQKPEPGTGPNLLSYAVLAVIILILVAIAIPDMKPVHRRSKPKQSEARTNLGAIFTTQVSYFANANTYSNDFTLLNWAPAGGSLYAYTCGAGIIENTKGEAYPASALNIGVAQVSGTGFTCMTVGNIDDDPTLDYWTINDAKMIWNVPTSDLEY